MTALEHTLRESGRAAVGTDGYPDRHTEDDTESRYVEAASLGTKVVALADWNVLMPQNVVGRGDVEEKVRQRELKDVAIGGQGLLVGATAEGGQPRIAALEGSRRKGSEVGGSLRAALP